MLVAALRNTEQQIAELGAGNIGLIEHLGKVLFTDFVVPFEISSVLFLSAMIGAVVIGKKEPKKIVTTEPVQRAAEKEVIQNI